MICSRCRREVKEETKFCPYCGNPMGAAPEDDRPLPEEAPVPERRMPPPRDEMEETPEDDLWERHPRILQVRKKGSGKRLPFFLLGIIVMAALVVAMLFGGLLSIGSSSGRVEGKGYSSPEDAVTAYAKALKSENEEKMLATFCVETYCENFNLEAQIERMSMYNISFYQSYPVTANGSSFQAERSAALRSSQIEQQISWEMLALTAARYPEDEALQTILEGQPQKLDSSMDIRSLVKKLQDEPGLSKMKIGKVREPAYYTNLYDSEANQENLRRQADCIGADEVCSRAVELTIDGETWVLCMDVARYGEKWYNLSQGGNLGALLGMNSFTGGIAQPSALS